MPLIIVFTLLAALLRPSPRDAVQQPPPDLVVTARDASGQNLPQLTVIVRDAGSGDETRSCRCG